MKKLGCVCPCPVMVCGTNAPCCPNCAHFEQGVKLHDNLQPSGDTLLEVIDHWMACRVDIAEVRPMDYRYLVTQLELKHLAEHIEKWMGNK